MNEYRARRRFGQNFLVDHTIISRIHAAVNAQPDQHLVEIGPGQGALTDGLAQRAGKLHLIELDRDLAARLRTRYAASEQVQLITDDALNVDLSALGRPLRIVGNLPYNISTPLLFHFLRYAHVISDMTLMLQREVALRLLAAPNTGDYGRLSVMAQFHCRGEWLLEVPPDAFKPAPKVQSAVIRLIPQTPPLTDDETIQRFSQIVRAAFSQRRKTLRNSLRQLLSAEQIEAAGIDPGQRAETLSVADFVRLSEHGADPSRP